MIVFKKYEKCDTTQLNFTSLFLSHFFLIKKNIALLCKHVHYETFYIQLQKKIK